MTFIIAQTNFTGPLEALLGLIEEKKCEITTISLQSATEEYIHFLEQQKVEPEDIADFLVIAARLIYIKSNALLPQPESVIEDQDAVLLEQQLHGYRVLRQEMRLLLTGKKNILYERPLPPILKDVYTIAPQNLTAKSIASSYAQLIARLQPFFLLRKTHVEKRISVARCVAVLKGVLAARGKITWKEMTSHHEMATDIPATFLALLDMYREGGVRITQDTPFGDISIKPV
jgi:segregation and condensation protein A